MTLPFHQQHSEKDYQSFVLRLLGVYLCVVVCRVIFVIDLCRNIITGRRLSVKEQVC